LREGHPLAASLTVARLEFRISRTVTGMRITAAEATDPAYWARHLCQPVRFSAD